MRENSQSNRYFQKISRIFLVFLYLNILINLISDHHIYATQTSVNDLDSVNIDEVLSKCIEEQTNNSELVDSFVQTNAVHYSNFKDQYLENIDDKIEFSVYTFAKTDGTEPKYDTFIDYQLIEPIKIYNQDELTVKIGEFLRPISPVKGALFTKSDHNDDWEFSGDIFPTSMGFQDFTIGGAQLSNGGDYSRVIIHFPSHSNPEAQSNELPRYILDYQHDPNRLIHFSGTQLIFILLAVLILIYFIRHLITRSKRRV